MKAGGFCSSADLMGFVKAELLARAGKLILLDGFPRNQENMDEWKNQKMEDCVDYLGALYFNCSEDEMKKRCLGRGQGRADDNEETIKKILDCIYKIIEHSFITASCDSWSGLPFK